MKPFIVRGIVDENGKLVESFYPTQVRRVISQETARRVTSILTDVVGMEDGTGKNARIVNIAVAGKTGTAQKFDFTARAYSSQKVRTAFMGFFPAEDPKIAMLIVLDEPQRDRWGGMAAAPVFKNIGEQLLNRFKTGIRRNPVPEMEIPIPENKMGLQFVSAPATLDDIVEMEADETLTPDFRGLTIREALNKSRERGIDIHVVGSGWAREQTPPAGMPLPESGVCSVTFRTGS